MSLTVTELVQQGNVLKASLTASNIGQTSRVDFVICNALCLSIEAQRSFPLKYDRGSATGVMKEIIASFKKRYKNDTLIYTLNFKDLNNNKTYEFIGDIEQIIDKSDVDKLTINFIAIVDLLEVPGPFEDISNDSELNDFTLVGCDGSVHAHRSILAGSSPVLRHMLLTEWKDTAEGKVHLPNVTAVTLKHLKDYIYLQKLPCTGLQELLMLSKYLMMPELEKKTIFKLLSHMKPDNLYETFTFAIKNDVKKLVLATLDSVQRGDIKIDEVMKVVH